MRRRLPLLKTIVSASAAFLVVAIALLLFVRIDRVVVARGRLAGGSVAVNAPQSGLVQRVLVRPGERVARGRPLIALEPHALRADSARTRAQLEAQTDLLASLEAERDHLVREVQPAEVDQAARALKQSDLVLTRAEGRLALKRQLHEAELATLPELQDAQLERDLAGLARQEAQQTHDGLAARQALELEKIEEQIHSARGNVDAERATLADLDRRLRHCTIEADTSGTMIGADLLDLTGRAVTEGQELCRIAVGGADRFEGRLADLGGAKAHAGLPVKIRLEAYPWLLHGTVRGRLDFVAGRGDTGGFPVIVALDGGRAPGPLRDGMLGEARIVLEEKVSLARLLVEKVVGKSSS